MADPMRLQSVLRYSGLNQSEFAKLLGVSPSKLTKLLQGKGNLTFEDCAMLYQHFNIDPAWFFKGEGNPEEVHLLDDVVPRKKYDELKEKYSEIQEELLRNYRMGKIRPEGV